MCRGAGFKSMAIKIHAHKVVILFLLFTIPTFRCFQINRVTYGEDIDSNKRRIYRSQDSFTNIQGYEEDCTSKSSSCLRDSCKGNTCCKCKCNKGLTFFSYRHGCLSPDNISSKTGKCYSLITIYNLRLIATAVR